MKKSYLIAPLFALLLFAAAYVQFRREENAREQARILQIQADRKAQLTAEVEARRHAVVEAVRVQEQRRKERENREADERSQQAERQFALLSRDRAFSEQQALSARVSALKNELAAEHATLAQLSATRRAALAEQVFLKEFLAQAEANVTALADVIAKLPPADLVRLPASVAAPAKGKP